MSSCNIDAQKAPDLDQVVFNLQNRLQKAQGISFNVESKNNRISTQVMALRPNYYKVERTNQCIYSDGKSFWQYFPLPAVYIRDDQKDVKSMNIPFAKGFEMYSPPSNFKGYRAVEETEFEGKRAFALIEETSLLLCVFFLSFPDP